MGWRITDAQANGTIKYVWRILVTMFLSRVFIGNTKTISRRTVRIALETEKGTVYLLQDFFWSDVCRTHISSQRIARTRMKRTAHRANQKNECVHTGTWYTWIHGTTHDTAVHKSCMLDRKTPNGLFLVKIFYWPTRCSSPRAFQWALVRPLEIKTR